MKRILTILAATMLMCACSGTAFMTDEQLMDKIKGAWAGKVIGCTYGLPTEFQYCGRMIPDSVLIPWTGHEVLEDWKRTAGNDDVYMNFSFIEVLDRLGLDAPADSFAVEFANAPYWLWHANQQGRYNILHGIMPPESGHWINNPHADDIDFQIEADFAGIISPGMPRVAELFSDTTGHIMNYGDGWYGGLYVAEMYSLAFVRNDIGTIVREALEAVPQQSRFYRCISDVIAWHDENPDDWKSCWEKVGAAYSESYGCPGSIGESYNIDVVINCAYVVMGLLYGDGDIERSCDIATRCGQDSDCNPSTALGILGTMYGYSRIPEKWVSQVREIEDFDYAHTGLSLNDIYRMSYDLSREVIVAEGGKIRDGGVEIRLQKPRTVRFEQSFQGLSHSDPVPFGNDLRHGDASLEFDGCGIIISGGPHYDMSDTSEYVAEVEVGIDGGEPQTCYLPSRHHDRSYDTIFFSFELEQGHHSLTLHLKNPTDCVVSTWKYITFSK